MNVPNEQNGANAIIGSVTKKNFTQIFPSFQLWNHIWVQHSILKFSKLES